MNTEQQLEKAIELMAEAFMLLSSANHDARTRELSVSIIQLEDSMMWLNKDRTMRGFLKAYPTHIEEK
jgi:hypothetical protein